MTAGSCLCFYCSSFSLFGRRIGSAIYQLGPLLVSCNGYAYGSLLLGGDLAHAQPPSKTSEHFLAGLKFSAGVVIGVDSRAEVALLRDWRSKSPSNKLLVKEWEPGLFAPVGDDTIVTPKISLSQSADIEI